MVGKETGTTVDWNKALENLFFWSAAEHTKEDGGKVQIMKEEMYRRFSTRF